MTPSPKRRTLLAGLATLPLLGLAEPAPAAVRAAARTLSFLHLHTDERLTVTYFDGAQYRPQALRRIQYLLRDFRTDEVHRIDPALLDVLYGVGTALGADTFEVISGYRSPKTNRALRRHSDGVAQHSLHMDGRAIDVRVAGLPTAKLRDAGISLGRGGVGYYPASDFVHLDTGRVRTW